MPRSRKSLEVQALPARGSQPPPCFTGDPRFVVVSTGISRFRVGEHVCSVASSPMMSKVQTTCENATAAFHMCTPWRWAHLAILIGSLAHLLRVQFWGVSPERCAVLIIVFNGVRHRGRRRKGSPDTARGFVTASSILSNSIWPRMMHSIMVRPTELHCDV